MTKPTRLQVGAALLPLVAFLAVYVPRVGHGFVLDDYRWVLESKIGRASDLVGLFVHSNGFYRPMVALTFGSAFVEADGVTWMARLPDGASFCAASPGSSGATA